jgi:hypothetical protein
MNKSANSPFARRIDEMEVARILQLISVCPNRREQPRAGDLPGEFDFWFDGGAGRHITGWSEYSLDGGIQVVVPVTPGLIVTITFPDGRGLYIRETAPAPAASESDTSTREWIMPPGFANAKDS